MRLAVLVAFVLALVGCARGSETLVLDWQGSDEGYPLALEAADEWASVCGAAIVVGRGNGGVPVSEVEGDVDGVPLRRGITQYKEDRTAAYVILTRFEGEPEVTRHEFGHALGIEGHSTSPGVMHVPRTQGSHVEPSDCAMLPVR